jgi:hypothetical protein
MNSFKFIFFIMLFTLSAQGVFSSEIPDGWSPDKHEYVQTENGIKPSPEIAIYNVCAWPNLTELPNGTIIATIFNKPSHGSMEGEVECWSSIDKGNSWKLMGSPVPHEPNTVRMNHAAGINKDGNLVVIISGWSDTVLTDQPKYNDSYLRKGILPAYVAHSSNEGKDWTVYEDAFPYKSPDDGVLIPFGDIIIGPSGHLYAAAYSAKPNRDWRLYVLKSSDDGKSWKDPIPIDSENPRNETAIFHLGEGNWFAVARQNGLYLYESRNNARSWDIVNKITAEQQHPGHLIRLADGKLLLTYGNRTNGKKGIDVLYSEDEGQNWGGPFRIADFEGDGGYPASLQLKDGNVLTVFYSSFYQKVKRYHMAKTTWSPTSTFE